MSRHLVVALCVLTSALAHTPRAADDEPTTTSEESESETHVVRVGWVRTPLISPYVYSFSDVVHRAGSSLHQT